MRMAKAIQKAISGMMLVVLTATTAFAETMEVRASAARFRVGAGMEETVAGLVMNGDRVQVLERSGKWARVNNGERTGWVHGNLLRRATGEAATAPQPPPRPQPTTEEHDETNFVFSAAASPARSVAPRTEAPRTETPPRDETTVQFDPANIPRPPRREAQAPCVDCGTRRAAGPVSELASNVGAAFENAPMPPPRPRNIAPVRSEQPAPRATRSADVNCFSKALLASAKKIARNEFGNRPNSLGRCAYGVRRMLNDSGIHPGGGLGHAIDYQTRNRLKNLGFENMIRTYKTSQSAPPGAILVFEGPQTKTYMRTGYIGVRGRHGNYVGHIAVKGDDGFYYTDGRTRYPAVANRRLVGVYVMKDPSKLPAKAKRNAQIACAK